MTVALKLPEEVLFIIFENLFRSDLWKCQEVCRAWYFPAHVTILKDVRLQGDSQIRKFIQSIDSNPSPSYLKAVKKLRLIAFDDSLPNFQFNNENVSKLFLRFSNLTDIDIQDAYVLEGFTDQVCKNLLKKCPKLSNFEISASFEDSFSQYGPSILEVRPLSTLIEMDKIDSFDQHGGVVRFLSDFPRLKRICEYNEQLNKFHQILQVLENTPGLTSIQIDSGNDDKNFAEIYLSRKSKDDQQTLVKRLSNITDLCMRFDHYFCTNKIQFVTKYLTGLKDFAMYSDSNQDAWTDLQNRLFANNIMVILQSTNCFVHINRIQLSQMTRCARAAMDKLFYQKSPTCRNTRKRQFRICVSDHLRHISIKCNRSAKNIEIAVDDALSLQRFADHLFGKIQSKYDIDVFALEIGSRGISRYKPQVDMFMYDELLLKMPTIKEVILDVPASFVEFDELHPKYGTKLCEAINPLVEKLTLRATIYGKFQTLLGILPFTFPNLNCLNIHYCSGTWNPNGGEFSVFLLKCSLGKLTMDATPVKTKTVRHLRKNYGFFVVEVNLTSSNEQRRYKVSLDLSSVCIIHDGDLKGYIIGDDYLQVRIMIRDLQSLELCMYKDLCNENETNDMYMQYSISNVKRAILTL